jgi:hypothetical protein
MTGYLQRLAASVAQPSPRLHPVVGSIFAEAGQEMALTAVPQEDGFAYTEERTGVSPTRSARDFPEDVNRRRHDVAAEPFVGQHVEIASPDGQRRSPEQHTGRENFQPLLPRETEAAKIPEALPETVHGQAASPQPFNAISHAGAAGTSIAAALQAAHLVVDDRSTASRRDEITLLPTRAFYQGPVALTTVTGDAGKWANPESSVASRRSAQSDDIQIHIGRIEVTAVAQPTPRPAAAPARKAMSLAEYLGRRSRGAR